MAEPGTFYRGEDGLLYATTKEGEQLPPMAPNTGVEFEYNDMGMTEVGAPQASQMPNTGSGGAGGAPGGAYGDEPIQYRTAADAPFTPDPAPRASGEGGTTIAGSQAPGDPQPAPGPVADAASGGGRQLPVTTDLGVPAPTAAATARSTPAKWVDQPLSPLRTTQQQVEHSIYAEPTTRVGELTGEEIDADARLSSIQNSIDSGDRRDKERDIAAREQLLNREGQLIAKEALADQENQKRAEMHAQMRQTDAKRQVYEERVRDAAIDPKRYFRDMGVFSKIIAIVGSTLQGYAMGMSGQGGNTPMVGLLQELNKQDIEDQKLEYENAVAQHERLDSQYQRAIEVWGDPELAELQLEKDKLAIADEWIALNEASAANDMQRFAWQEERGKLQVAQETINEEMQTRKRDKIVSQLQATPKKLVGGGGGSGMAGTRAQKPEPDKIAQAQAKLERARAAKAYAENYAAENGPDAKLPGFGVGGRLAKGALSAVQGTGTREQEDAAGHVSALASSLKQPGENSDQDFDRIKGRVVGNGEVGNLYRAAEDAERAALRELQAGHGIIPTQ